MCIKFGYLPSVLFVFVTVGAQTAPSITNLPLTGSKAIEENTGVAFSVYTASATDPDGDAVSFSITSWPTSTLFDIDSTSGLISTTVDINFEALAGSYMYTLTVYASDGVLSSSEDISVVITDVNEPLFFNQNTYATEIAEGLPIGTYLPDPLFNWTDPDADEARTCYLSCPTPDFVMDQSNCSVKLNTIYRLDDGRANQVTCDVTAVDKGGHTASATLIVSITDANNYSPELNPTSYLYYIQEDSAVGTTLGTVIATDGDSGTYGNLFFTIDQSGLNGAYFQINSSTGEITLQNSLLNCNCPLTSLAFPAVATDGGLSTGTASVTVYVQPQPTTTTIISDSFQTFTQDNISIAWLCSCIALGLLTLGVTIFVCLKYVMNWPSNFCHNAKINKQQRKQQKTPIHSVSREPDNIDKPAEQPEPNPYPTTVRQPPPAEHHWQRGW